MALNIKNSEVERLAGSVARLTGETKTEAIRRALIERETRLRLRAGQASRRERLDRFLQNRVWPTLPAEVRGQPLPKDEEERILGFGPEGA